MTGPETDPPAADPQGIVEEVTAAHARMNQLGTEFQRLQAARPWRLGHRARIKAAQEELRLISSQLRAAMRDLHNHGVGARAGQWGVFSTTTRFSLERSLRNLVQEDRSGTSDQARALLLAMPALRLRAHRGDDHAEREAEDALLSLLHGPQAHPGARLVDHLPGDRRPLPAKLADLHRTGPPLTLWVSRDVQGHRTRGDEDQLGIRLHDIVVVGPTQRGRGLGTAALRYLCRFADREGAFIEGDLVPGHDPGEAELRRVAGWYHRHGFRVDDTAPEQWPLRARMVRPPNNA